VPIGAVALGMWFYHIGTLCADDERAFWTPFVTIPGWAVLSALTAVLALIALCVLDINLTGPHRLYRNQLARTFTQMSESETDPVRLTMINPVGFAPYHLINAAVNLPSSTSMVLRERKSDFFLFFKGVLRRSVAWVRGDGKMEGSRRCC